MTIYQCPYCSSLPFTSETEYQSHQIKAHGLYKGTDTNIAEDTIRQLRTTMAKVKWLHETNASTRGDDRILELMFMRIFDKILVYDEKSGLIQFRNKEGVTYEEWRTMVSAATIDRAGRKIRELFPDLRPSAETIMKRKLKEQAIRGNIVKLSHSEKEYKEIKKEFE